jgi:hypothetical protein
LSGSLETQAISERLTLAEPATLPREPISPNVKLILALGVVLAGGSGGASMVLAEFLDRSVRSAAQLARLIGDTPLAAIPTLTSPRERRRRWMRRGALAAATIVLVAVGLFWVDRQVRPLSVLGYQAQAMVTEWFAATFAGTSEEAGN